MTATFEDFWAIAKRWRGRYSNPRKGRGGAEPAWDRAVKDGADPDQIMLGAQGYVAHIEQDDVHPQHVLQARTFINGWHWEQYVELARETQERKAVELLERRRTYYGYGWRDACNGTAQMIGEFELEPEVQEAYEMGRRDAVEKQAAPKLRVVG